MKSKRNHSLKEKSFFPRKLTLENRLVIKEINGLLEKADALLSFNEPLAQKYVKEARKLQMKTRTKFPNYWKKRLCKKCKILLKPGVNARIRLSHKKSIVIKCGNCGSYTRIPYYKSKSEKYERAS